MLQYYWNKLLKKLQFAAIKNSKIDKTSKVEAGTVFVNSSMDRYSFCGYDCKIINCNIGAFCSIADNVVIGGARHPIEWTSTSPVFYAGRDSVKEKFSEFERAKDLQTNIGNDVWIGDNVLIKGGITIGDGAVIGMGSVVTKDIAPYTIVAGVPAKIIRMRFSNEIVEKLKNLKWWDFKDSCIREYAKYVREPEEFLEEIAKIQ